jgi:Secretion system C-terminal sorting domain/Fibronectin type III domain
MKNVNLTHTWLKRIAFIFLCFGLSSAVLQAQVCSAPSNLGSNVLVGNSVTVSWAAIPGALNYTVQYRIGNAGVWITTTAASANNRTITNLRAETIYTWRVRANCSVYSSVATFTSGGGVGGNVACSAPSNQNANVISPTSASLSWSSSEGALYYSVQYRIGSAGTWINGGSVNALSLTINGLTTGVEYQWRVKASCSVYSSVASFSTGVSGNTGNSSCSQPSNTDAINISATGAILTWSAIQEAVNYTVQYRQGLTGAYITAGTVTGTSLTLSALTAGTEYSWRVKASCSDYSSQSVFTTTSTNGGNTGGGPVSTSCSSPSNTNAVAIFTTSANIEWEPQGGALDYTVQYRLKNTFTYTTLGVFTGNTATLSGLLPNTEYEWRVKANCSPYGSDVSFTTLASFALVRNNIQTNAASVKKMSVFPNPAQGDEINITTEIEGGQIQIINYAGQVVVNKVVNSPQDRIDIAQLNSGLYIVRMQFQDGSVESNKLIISH